MKTYLKTLAPLCAGALLIASPLAAQTTTATPEVPGSRENGHTSNSGSMTGTEHTTINGKVKTDAEVSNADRRFFKKAAELGEKEVALSRIAADRATNPQVKSFATDMVRAHSAANTELLALSRQKGVLLAEKDRLDNREIAKKWSEKKAAEFDEDYVDTMIDAHEDTVSVLEKGAKSKDADVAAYATKLLPDVKTHLEHAKQLEDALD